MPTTKQSQKNRGGARKNAGAKQAFVRLEIGKELLTSLRAWCKLRKELGYNRITPEQFLLQVCKDRLDSPSFTKELERLRVEQRVRKEGIDSAYEF